MPYGTQEALKLDGEFVAKTKAGGKEALSCWIHRVAWRCVFAERYHSRASRDLLTRALLGGGAFERPPLRFFEDSEKTAAHSAAGFSPTLPPIFSATFVKISTQCHVRSGSPGQVK